MLRQFKALKIGDKFEYGDRIFVKVETVYKTCCIPEYNAYAIDNENDRILVPSLKPVIRVE